MLFRSADIDQMRKKLVRGEDFLREVLDFRRIHFGARPMGTADAKSEGFDPLFDVLADFVQVHVARHELGERVGDADDRAAELLLAHAVGPPEASGSRHPAARRGDGASECVFHLSVSVSVCVPARAGNEKAFPRQEKGFIIFVDHARHLSPAIF